MITLKDGSAACVITKTRMTRRARARVQLSATSAGRIDSQQSLSVLPYRMHKEGSEKLKRGQ